MTCMNVENVNLPGKPFRTRIYKPQGLSSALNKKEICKEKVPDISKINYTDI